MGLSITWMVSGATFVRDLEVEVVASDTVNMSAVQ